MLAASPMDVEVLRTVVNSVSKCVLQLQLGQNEGNDDSLDPAEIREILLQVSRVSVLSKLMDS